jgi:energy-coupling factor transporter ATP-binding protein EcfA2
MPLLMGSGSGDDLFRGFNEVEVSEVLRRCTNCGRFVLIGPPRSGKTFFRENYLEGRLGVGVTVDEHTLGITTTTKAEGEEAKGELGLREKVMRLLKRMTPLIRKFADKVSVDVEELRRVLGDRAPRPIVEGARGIIGDSAHRAYYISWECVEKPNACTSDADASRALGLIKGVFDDRNKGVPDDRKVRIRWFKAEYIPPGLVEEVIELIREKGEDGARRVLEDWVNAYFKAIDTLSKVLGLKENLLEWDELSIGFLSSFVNNSANYVIAGLAATPLIGAASLAIISVLTYTAFKKEGGNYLKEIIELRESLERLLVKGPDGRLDFNELGKLLVYRVAYAMGMSYDEAKEALMDITGLSIEELERRVNEIEKKIKELEEKFELFRQEVRAGIVTADVGEFAKGGIYLNIEVEDDGLRICVEGQCYNIVRAGKFNELVSEIKDKLLKQGFAVVVGPKGIGKSTLTAAVIWELLVNGDVGRVARVDVLNKENYGGFERFLRNYSREFINYFGRLLILYDPVSTETYERVDIDVEAPIQTNIERTIKDLMNAIKSISSEASKPLALIVIPSDVYNTLSEERRNELEGYRLDVSQGLINTELLAELIREYTRTKSNPNGCALSDRELSELAGELAKFDSGHALIARLIGEELARNNCSAREIKELINNAKGKAEAFVILHINGLFKVHEDPDTAKALVEVFTLRKPFVDSARPGDPILTPGIIELIGEKKGASLLQSAEGGELRGWLALRQHDLIEEAIKKLLKCIVNRSKECEELGDELEPWRLGTVRRSLREVSEKVRDVSTAVEYFVGNYGKEFTDALRDFSNECWKRAALIIGFALAGIPIVPRPEDLPESLNRCGVDDYLLVGDKIPPLIRYLAYTRVLTEAFVDKYNEAVAEVNRILNIAKNGGDINDTESFYGLGLASIIAKAVESGKPIEPGDADAALHIVSLTMQHAILLILTERVLSALVPLRDKALQRYLEVLASALDKSFGLDTVMYILNEFDYILNKYGDGVKGHAWTLVRVIDASINSLYKYLEHCDDYRNTSFRTELEHMVSRVAGLLDEIKKLNPSLGIIAWAHALLPALDNKCVRALMESVLGIDVVNKKAKEVAGELSRLRESVQELIRDEDFMGFVEYRLAETDEKAARREILEETLNLKYAWALYKLDNDELYEAEDLFNEAARERREIGDYQNYLDNSNWALRAKAIRSKLAGDELVKLVDEFRQLYEEAKKQPNTGTLSLILRNILGGYLVSLALKGGDEEIRRIEELLKEQRRGPGDYLLTPILTRLTLNALLSPRGELSGELKDKLVVKPGELIVALLGGYIDFNSLPALRAIYGTIKPGDEKRLCDESIDDPIMHDLCMHLVSRVIIDYSKELDQRGEGIWRQALINDFQRWISKGEVLDLLKKLGLGAESLNNELRGLIHELSVKSLPELVTFSFCSEHEQRLCSSAHLTYMLYALINGNEKLAKAHALYGAVSVAGKLPARLFLEAYRACCDLKSESFRLAIARLFFYHV